MSSKPRTTACLRCGEPIEQAEGKGRIRRRHDDCKAARDARRALAKGRLAAALKPGRPRRWVAGRCVCGSPVMMRAKSGQFPSPVCSSACATERRRHHREATLRELEARVWTPMLLPTFDGVCSICGDTLDLDVPWPSPMARSVAYTGAVTEFPAVSDMRLAHAACNPREGDELIPDTLEAFSEGRLVTASA